MKFEFNKDEWSKSFIQPGGYIAKIVGVSVRGDYIQVVFDIAEGAYKGIFMSEYKKVNVKGKFDIKKWNTKGIVNYDFQYAGAKYAFADLLDNLEKSNQTFCWKNETDDLKNKLIGVVYRKNVYEDKYGIMREGTDFPEFVTVKEINDKEFSIEPKGKEAAKDTKAAPTSDNDTDITSFNIEEDDIQF